MREQILHLLGNKIVYPENTVKKFLNIMAVRCHKESELYRQLEATLSKNRLSLSLIDDSSPELKQELTKLNCLAVHNRLHEWHENGHAETVVTRYLEKLVEELENPTFFGPSADLQAEEYTMLHTLLENTHFNQEKTELEGINNTNLRLVLQLWLLYPELITLPDSCKELLEGLGLSNCEL